MNGGMSDSEQIKLLREIVEATKDIKIMNVRLSDFDKRLKSMEIENSKIWGQKGIRFMNEHEQKIVGIVNIFNKQYGGTEKISGYDLIQNVLNSFAKSTERRKIIFISIINSLAFRFIEIICVLFLVIYFALKMYFKL